MAYKSSYTGPQIDQAVSHAVNMDVNPTAGHTDRVVSSGGVKSAINSVENDIAIRVVGNKTTYASGAAIGQYVIVDESTITGITDGLYKAAKAIPYNTVIDSTYLTAASGGGLNDLKAALGSYETIGNSHTLYRVGRLRILRVASFYVGNTTVTIPSGDRPLSTVSGSGTRNDNSNTHVCIASILVNADGSITYQMATEYNGSGAWTNASQWVSGTVVWMV